MKTFILAAWLIILAITVSFILYTQRLIHTPMQHLLGAFNRVKKGNFQEHIEEKNNSEFAYLYEGFNEMEDRIQDLIREVYEQKELKQRAELKQLQEQINPHFLYNTLDIIVWMIENEKQADAVKVVTALARFFRISLSRGKSIIPVRDELEHVRNYLMIQHMRFKNRFTYEIEADEDVMELASVKLILQPLVENAVYHGMEFMDGDGEIRIRVYRDGEDLYMRVSDNGLGMTKEQVEGMFMDKPHVKSGSGSGIGVRNVNERIRLYFGQEYGLSIESELDEGTVVTIHMRAVPYAETAEGEKIHVK